MRAFRLLAALVAAVATSALGQNLQSAAAIPLIVLTHILYGIGFWRGLFTTLKPEQHRDPQPVVLEIVSAETGKTEVKQ